VDWINAEQVSFYTAVVIIAFLVSLAVSYSRDTIKSFRISLCSSVVTGFFAFVIVGISTGRNTDGISGHVFYLAISALIGMSGKYQTRMIERILKQSGFIDNEDETP